ELTSLRAKRSNPVLRRGWVASALCASQTTRTSPRQLVADRAFDLDRLFARRPGHHSRVMRIEIRKRAGRGLQRIEKPPIEPEQMNVGDRAVRAERPCRAEAPVRDRIDLSRMIQALPARRMQRRCDERHPGQ